MRLKIKDENRSFGVVSSPKCTQALQFPERQGGEEHLNFIFETQYAYISLLV